MFFTGPEEDRLFGRVLLGRGPLAGAAYPLYFRVDLHPSVVPGDEVGLKVGFRIGLAPSSEASCLAVQVPWQMVDRPVAA